MPTYKVTDPTTGQTLRLTGDSPPTEEELNQIFNQTKPPTQETIQTTPFLPREAEVEKEISGRKDSVARLMEEYRTPYDFKEHPIKAALKPVVTVAKTFAIPFQRGESAVAGLGLGLQKGRPFEGLRNLRLGLAGKRQQELGDIVRTTGFGGETFNEPLARGIGFLSNMGLINVATSGRLLGAAKKAETVAKGKIPRVMGKDYTLQRAEQLDKGLEDLRAGFGSLKSDAIKQIGKNMVDAPKLSRSLPKLPQVIYNAIDDPIYAIEKLPDGSINPTIENLDKLKGLLADRMSGKDWLDATKLAKANIKQAYGAISEAIGEVHPEMKGALDSYHYFMKDIYSPVKKILTTGGQVVEKKLRGTLQPGAERRKQIAIEEFSKLWNEAPRLIKDVVKFNARQGVKRGLFSGAKEAAKVGILYKALKLGGRGTP